MRRTEGMIFAIVYVSLIVLFALTVSQGSTWGMTITFGGALLMGVPFLLWVWHRYDQAAIGIALVCLLMLVATIASGDGFQDPTMPVYPLVLVFAGMTLSQRNFAWFFVLAAFAVLAAGLAHDAGIVPVAGAYPNTATRLAVAITALLATGVAVSMLAREARQALNTAHEEIARRKLAEAGLEQLSRTDALTGVYSRRVFDEELRRLESSRRYPVTVIVADVDELKFVNDTRGHAAGDKLITDAARVLMSVVRPDDVLARIGGDEFVLLLPSTDEAAAAGIVHRIEAALYEHNHVHPDPELSISVGFAVADPGGLDLALMDADACMYETKANKKVVA